MFSKFYVDWRRKGESYQHIINKRNLPKMLKNKTLLQTADSVANIQTGHMNTTTKFILGGRK